MGLVIVLIPADFPARPHPAWNFYDFLPDPIGWGLVLSGVWALARAMGTDLGVLKWVGALALAISIPLWLPQVNHLLVPEFNPGLDVSFQWALSLPQSVFGLLLARELSQTASRRQPRDPYVAGRFGVFQWAFGALIVLPAVAYGGNVAGLVTPTLILFALVNIAFIYYLFAAHRRSYLGGPGPRDWAAAAASTQHETRPRD